MKFYLILLLTFFAMGCQKAGPDLATTWQSKNAQLIVTQNSKDYFIQIMDNYGKVVGNFMGQYNDGNINLGSNIGNVQYSKEKDKLYFGGAEFTRVADLEKEAAKIQSEKEQYHGYWKSKKESFIEMLFIQLNPDGTFKIVEPKPMQYSEFRNVEYNDGKIIGIYYYEVDNSHESTFELISKGANTLLFKSQDNEENLYERYVPDDEYTGTWIGKYYNFVIEADISRYKVTQIEKKDSKKEPFKTTANIRKGKLTYEGEEKDFYKFYLPTFELLTNGQLRYVDGANNELLSEEGKEYAPIVENQTSCADAKKVTITGDNVRVRSKPDATDNGNILFKLNKSDQPSFLSDTTNSAGERWYQICFQDKKGWVNGNFVQL